jgi:hypothetical protein
VRGAPWQIGGRERGLRRRRGSRRSAAMFAATIESSPRWSDRSGHDLERLAEECQWSRQPALGQDAIRVAPGLDVIQRMSVKPLDRADAGREWPRRREKAASVEGKDGQLLAARQRIGDCRVQRTVAAARGREVAFATAMETIVPDDFDGETTGDAASVAGTSERSRAPAPIRETSFRIRGLLCRSLGQPLSGWRLCRPFV